MSDYQSLPQYPNTQPQAPSTRMATPEEQKPIMKMINKMLKPKTMRAIKQLNTQRMPKKKHQVKFY